MQVDRLRLVGFKSFVEAAELEIRPGMTGIVGPNGCGKSNLAEALRWAMGESSARRLRGGEMDDLIFAGTAGRPPRNLAEVRLAIDNSARDAPRMFNDRAEIEVVRRIERGGGSLFRINGREVRARDVQLLFADAATGGHFSTVIGQGRVGAVIAAKPAERRLLLEGAAGTTGHQLRRREAESRLAAAEANLARLDHVIATLCAQLDTVKRQARQAQRYRRLAEEIRRRELLLFGARRRAAEAEARRVETELAAVEAAVEERAEGAATARQRRETAEFALPALRHAETAAIAESQRLVEARTGLERELQQVIAARGDAERRRAQLAADLQREEGRLADALSTLARLAAERGELAGTAVVKADRDAATRGLAEIRQRLAAAEIELQRATDADVQAAARHAAIDRRRGDLEARKNRLEAQCAETARQHAALMSENVPETAARAAAAAVVEAERRVENRRVAVDAAEQTALARQSGEAAAFEAQQQAAARVARLTAEAEALRSVLAPPQMSGATPILASLRIAAGFEAALGALFDDELTAPLDAGADAECCWIDLPVDAAAMLPEGARPLAAAVAAPSALARRLAQSGWVEDPALGRCLQPALAPGQCLVDREGRLWRWDGFMRNAPTQSIAARQLEQQRRLSVLAGAIAESEAEARAADRAAASSRADRGRATEAMRQAQTRRREAEAALAAARTGEAALARRMLSVQTRLSALDETAVRLAGELDEAAAAASENERELAALPEPSALRHALEAARGAAVEARRCEAEARAAIDRLAQAAEGRRERLAALDIDERSWRERAASAAAQRAALKARQAELHREMTALADRPAAIAAESDALGRRIATAAIAARQTADGLARGEMRLREADEQARAADLALAAAREQRARLEVLRDGAVVALATLDRDIVERLGASIDRLAAPGVGTDAEDPDAVGKRLERLLRERDSIGPVNLVAESEAAEIGARVEALQREHADLTEAIAKLRHGIVALDREAEQRLGEAFERVARHFEDMFVRLFGGGHAQLKLTEGGDGTSAGLEIMASPTGKRLQSLSLLSGGEQALTALALIFAVFLTNPAPICVLDEVDAPLDDANVERLCRLVAEIGETTGTRFLVVTHHRITMARADRLYGVTMVEPGVSRLVSVELAAAARLRQTA